MSFYLDASVLVPTLNVEAGTRAVDAFIGRNDAALTVSDFAAAETASALSRLVRTGVFDAADAHARLSDFDRWRRAMATAVEIHSSDMKIAGAFVRRFELKLRTPDALHLACCNRLQLTLVTLDRRLQDAAVALNIPVQMPQAPLE